MNADCWPWEGPRNRKGYGHIWHLGRKAYVHRLTWEKLHGEIPKDLCVLHRCDNPGCVNPRHLWLGTTADNNKDMVAKGRQARTYGDANGRHTHPEKTACGSKIASAKLTEAQVVEMRRLHVRGATTSELGKIFGVHRTTAGKAVTGKAWAHVISKDDRKECKS